MRRRYPPGGAASGHSRPTEGAAFTVRGAPSTHFPRTFHALSIIEALLASIVVIAIGEIGDKTQLLALMLAMRLRRPAPIILGIVVATLANHTLAAWVGTWVRHAVPEPWLSRAIAASFFAVALWALKPDRAGDAARIDSSRLGAFALSVIAFFLAEMGDKTQIATAVLAAQFDNIPAVVAGTTLGMLVADVPVVLIGHAGAHRIPLSLIRVIAACLFAVMGILALLRPLPG